MEFIEINDIWFNTAAIVSIEPVGDGPDYKGQQRLQAGELNGL